MTTRHQGLKVYTMSTDHMCQDLIDDILERVPVKSLVRFRSVSKSWYSGIGSRDFIDRYTLQSVVNAPPKIIIKRVISYKNEDGLMWDIYTLHSKDQLPLCSSGDGDITAVKLPYITGVKISNLIRFVEPIGSCNGVICLFHSLKIENKIRLWNFSVRRELIIPDHPYLQAYMIIDGNVALGFGFDSTTNDYKIVAISNCHSKCSFLYYMNTNSWSEIASPTTPFNHAKLNACFFKGTLHWLVKCNRTESISHPHSLIMTFDLSTHIFGTISLPEPSCTKIEITTISGSIGVITINGYNIQIFARREYGNDASWSVFHKIDITELGEARVWKAINNADLLFGRSYNMFKVYNPETGLLSRDLKLGDCCQEVDMETYVESLELLDRGTPCGRNHILYLTKEWNIKEVRL